MADYLHGVYTNEMPTPLRAPVPVASALVTAIGIAPVHKLEDYSQTINKPLLINSFAEAVSRAGYTDQNWDKFTLAEVIDSQMRVHAISPLVLINVWDPDIDKLAIADTLLPISNNKATLADPMAIIKSVVVKIADPADTTGASFINLVRNTDYSLAYDSSDNLVITLLQGGLGDGATELVVSYDQADPSKVTATDIIGGVDATGNRTGIEAIDDVFLKLNLVPCLLVAPNFSHLPNVYTALVAKAKRMVYGLQAMAIIDIPTTGTYADYSELPNFKSMNSFVEPNSYLLRGRIQNSDRVYYGSTRAAGLQGEVDNSNRGYPFEGVSNKVLAATAIVDDDDNEQALLDDKQANYLNANGITAFINFQGWRPWGIQTAAFPGDTDIKNAEYSVRRMFIYLQNLIILSHRQEVAKPGNLRLRDRVLLSVQATLDIMVSVGALLNGTISFTSEDNPTLELMQGNWNFALSITPPNAAKALIFNVSYDPEGLQILFS
jgi:phage tail sheath protein FI